MFRLGATGVRAMLTAARVLGFAPYAFDDSGRCLPSMSWRICSTVVWLFFGVYSYIIVRYQFEDNTTITHTGLLIYRVIVAVEMVVRYWTLVTRTHPRMYAVFNSEPVWRGAPHVTTLFVLVVSTLIISVNVLTLAWLLEKGAVSSAEFVGLIAMVMYNVHRCVGSVVLSVLLHCIAERFRSLNECLKEHYAVCRAQKVGAPERLCQRSYITDFRKQHRRTVAVIEELTFCYGPSVVTDGLSDLWVGVYSIYITFTFPLDIFSFLSITGLVALLLRWSYLLSIAARVSSQGNAALAIANDICLHCILTDGEQREMQLLSDSLFHIPVRVALMGEVELNINLLFQVAAAAIGYIIVLLQFGGTICQRSSQNSTELQILPPSTPLPE